MKGKLWSSTSGDLDPDSGVAMELLHGLAQTPHPETGEQGHGSRANFTSEGAVSIHCLLRTNGLCELAFSSRDQSPDLPHSWKWLSGSLHLSWIGIFPLPLQTPSKHAVIQTMHENVCGEECARLNTQGEKKEEHEKPDI